jgi:hypothetical protein
MPPRRRTLGMRGLAARGRPKLELVVAEGLLADAGSTLQPAAVPSLAIEAAGSANGAFSLWRNNGRKRLRPR